MDGTPPGAPFCGTKFGIPFGSPFGTPPFGGAPLGFGKPYGGLKRPPPKGPPLGGKNGPPPGPNCPPEMY